MEGKESLHFQAPPLTEIDIFHYRVKNVHVLLHLSFLRRARALLCICVWLKVRFLAADVGEVIHLVTAISKSPCVCTFLCKCGTCVCSGKKTSPTESERESEREYVWGVCNGRMKKNMIYGREWGWKALGTATPVNPDKKKKEKKKPG